MSAKTPAEAMKVFVLNCGSSSVKYQLFDMGDESVLAKGRVERIGTDEALVVHQATGRDAVHATGTILEHTAAIQRVLALLTSPEHGVIRHVSEIGAVGHRVLHGGEYFSGSVLVTPEVKQAIRACFDLGPLHNPANLAGIEAAENLIPGVPQVATFDTGFHSTMPRYAYLYALPYVLYRRYHVRRYGFHGTSHRYVSERAAALMGRPPAELKLISCHLGNGASVAAVQGGASVDTSMGFTPLEGLVMGTRSGDLDPAVLPYVMAKEELGLAEISSMLNKHSGLLGVSGVSGDMRDIEEEMEKGNPRARDAFLMFTYRLRKYIGAYAAAMDGVDAILFTGGIGENSWRVREEVCQHLNYLGVQIDPDLNRNGQKEKDIATPSSRVRVWVIPTNEELVIARDARDIVLKEKEKAGA